MNDTNSEVPTGELSVFPSSGEGWTELSRTKTTQGRLFEKHILNLGELRHPATGSPPGAKNES